MLFKPISRTGDYRTLGFYDVWERLGADDEGNGAAITAAMSKGLLAAYVQVEGDPRFYEVPATHWRENAVFEGSPSETLTCWGMSDVPEKFCDRPLLFFADEVDRWRAERDGEAGGPHSKLHFIPAQPKGELRVLDEALTLVISGTPSQDSHLWLDPQTGDTKITFPKGIETVEQAQDWVKRRVIATTAITGALQESRLRTLVQTRSGTLCRVDRLYWLRAHAGTSSTIAQYEGLLPEEVVGQPILVDLAELEEWRAVSGEALHRFGASHRPPSSDETSVAKWLKLKITEPQLQVMRFFAAAEKSGLLPGGEKWKGATALREVYVKEWINKPGESRGPELTREPFEKWLGRYLDGWRAPGKGQRGWQRASQ